MSSVVPEVFSHFPYSSVRRGGVCWSGIEGSPDQATCVAEMSLPICDRGLRQAGLQLSACNNRWVGFRHTHCWGPICEGNVSLLHTQTTRQCFDHHTSTLHSKQMHTLKKCSAILCKFYEESVLNIQVSNRYIWCLTYLTWIHNWQFNCNIKINTKLIKI